MTRTVLPLCLLLALIVAPIRADEEAEQPYTTLRIGDPMPEVDFLLADGTSVTRDDLLGRYVVIDFWATWCGPCIGAFPRFNEIEKTFAGRPIDFYSVTYEPESKIRPVLDEKPLDTAVGIDNDFATFVAFQAWGIPTVYIFNPEGRAVSVIGPSELSDELLEEVLAGEIPDVEQYRGWEDPEGAEEYFRSTLVDG